jgi:hypothetical protein
MNKLKIFSDIEVTEKEIQACIKEYSKKCYFGTREKIKLDRNTAIYTIKGRKSHKAYLNSVHKSHKMTKWGSTILAPCGTARFYSIRECKKCGREQYYAAAGRFIDPELKEECKGE